jgi:NAD(P)-dependent dehydrogenase (short-subunit alcohol dehydrogenase family)
VFQTQTAGDVVGKVVQELGRLDILVNNASVQHLCTALTNITPEQLQETFAINVFGYFFMAQVRRGLGSGLRVCRGLSTS